MVEAGVAEHAHHQVAAFVHAAVLGGDGGLADPVLQALDVLVVAFCDFGLEGLQVGSGGERAAGGQERGGGEAPLQEETAVECGHDFH